MNGKNYVGKLVRLRSNHYWYSNENPKATEVPAGSIFLVKEQQDHYISLAKRLSNGETYPNIGSTPNRNSSAFEEL